MRTNSAVRAVERAIEPVLSRVFALGKERARSGRAVVFERGRIDRDERGYRVTRGGVEVPPAVLEEVLRRAASGERVGVFAERRGGELRYQCFEFVRPDGDDLIVVYDQLLDRIVSDHSMTW
jgi:hypothetical protein